MLSADQKQQVLDQQLVYCSQKSQPQDRLRKSEQKRQLDVFSQSKQLYRNRFANQIDWQPLQKHQSINQVAITNELPIQMMKNNINMNDSKKKLNYLLKVNEELNAGEFKASWLSKVTNQAKVTQMQSVVNSKNFSGLFQVPLIISDPEFLRRRQTFEVYTKNKYMDIYQLQVKRAQGLISNKATYSDVISQIHNHKLQTQSSKHKSESAIYNNCLWSEKYQSTIHKQSRLNNLTKILDQNKLKGKDELLRRFEQFFHQKQAIPKTPQTVEGLLQQVSTKVEQPIEKVRTTMTTATSSVRGTHSRKWKSMNPNHQISQILVQGKIEQQDNLQLLKEIKRLQTVHSTPKRFKIQEYNEIMKRH